jgi:asparagine synthase (glutamine-hydrolysing)
MVATLHHRGPDDRGVWESDGAQLGHARLTIVDLTSAGRQPMELDDLVLVYNGEVYNHQELRAELGVDYRGTSDSETILHLYREHGDGCVYRMTGMFAFAVWDRRRRRLFMARDRLGIKPLHYGARDGQLAFASELKALLELGTPPVDRSAIRDLFTYRHIPAPKTAYQGIRKLPPAHTLVWQDGRFETRCYWHPEISSVISDPDEALEGLDAVLRTAIPEHLMSDVPVGVFLSGGLDSATVTAHVPAGTRTFTLGFDVARRDEAPAARRVAETFGTDHHEVRVGPADLATVLDLMPGLFDEPFGDSGAWSNWAVADLAAGYVKVALCGEGADELFLGYQRQHKQLLSPMNHFVSAVGSLAPRLSLTGRSIQRRSATGFDRFVNHICPFAPAQQAALLHPDLLDDAEDDPTWCFAGNWRDDLDERKAMQWTEIKTTLPDGLLTRVDRASMAHSLEVRPPLLDHRVVELALRLHPDLLADGRGGPGKLVLRGLMEPRLPPGHLDRPKGGFNLPIRRWIKSRPGLLQDALDRLTEAEIIRRPRFASFSSEQIWTMLVLDRWISEEGPSDQITARSVEPGGLAGSPA